MTWGMAVLRAPVGTSYWTFLGDEITAGSYLRVTADTTPELFVQPKTGTPQQITLTQGATVVGPLALTPSGGNYTANVIANIPTGTYRVRMDGIDSNGQPRTTYSTLIITGGTTLLIGNDFDLLIGDDFTLLIGI